MYLKRHNIHYAQSSATLKRRATTWYTEADTDLDLLRQIAKVSAQEAAECLGLDEQSYRQKEAHRALPALFVDYLALKSGDLSRLSKSWSGWVFANDRLFPPDYAIGFDPVHILNIHWLQEINAALRGRLCASLAKMCRPSSTGRPLEVLPTARLPAQEEKKTRSAGWGVRPRKARQQPDTKRFLLKPTAWHC